MARTYLEALFRHKYVLMLPIILGFAAGAYAAVQVPREYVTGASIWTDNRVPAETTVGTTGGQSPPSSGQATLLMQWLATRQFMTAVVEASPLASEFRQADRLTADRLLSQVAGQTAVATPGPQLMTVSVRWDDPEEAIGLNRAILDQFAVAQVQGATERARAQVEYDKQRMDAAKQALADAPRSDSAQSLYADAAAAYNASTLNLASIQASALQVVDQPDVAYPQARRKTLVLGAAGGLLAGLTISLLGLILIMARDRSMRSEADIAAAGLTVGGVIPAFPRERQSAGPRR